jgi:hypothetical protein
MNPSSNEAPGLQLPPPVMEQAPVANSGAENVPTNSPEQGPTSAAEQAPKAGSVTTPTTTIPLPLPANQPASDPKSDVSATTQLASLAAADDTDLIEKEWVNKAKAIVERTRDDPHKQSEELTVVKADYLQKRYNKTLKLNK